MVLALALGLPQAVGLPPLGEPRFTIVIGLCAVIAFGLFVPAGLLSIEDFKTIVQALRSDKDRGGTE